MKYLIIIILTSPLFIYSGLYADETTNIKISKTELNQTTNTNNSNKTEHKTNVTIQYYTEDDCDDEEVQI